MASMSRRAFLDTPVLSVLVAVPSLIENAERAVMTAEAADMRAALDAEVAEWLGIAPLQEYRSFWQGATVHVDGKWALLRAAKRLSTVAASYGIPCVWNLIDKRAALAATIRQQPALSLVQILTGFGIAYGARRHDSVVETVTEEVAILHRDFDSAQLALDLAYVQVAASDRHTHHQIAHSAAVRAAGLALGIVSVFRAKEDALLAAFPHLHRNHARPVTAEVGKSQRGYQSPAV